ncbi:MAG: hypothetical protein KKF78_00420, partial [Candidatus Omnitrophica bacterium]|nr:hypothetical protein [Candidatus Omnitrophota bacterium]
DREGWSSSIYQEDGSLVCSNSRNGHTSSDRICVSPAEEITVDIPLSPVPEVNIYGRVIDSIGNPIGGAVIQALWPRSDSAYWRKGGALQTATTQMDGSFVFSVPAVQAMFPDSNPYNNYLRVWANARVELRSCCDTLTKQNRNSATKEVGPLNIGDSDRNIGDLIISTLDISCGNVTGKIKNDFTENPLPDVTAIIYSQTEITNGLGKYIYDCPEEGYRLSAGNASFIARHNGYYEYRSDGNNWYNRGPNVNIVANEVSEYDAVLWPRGYGNIEVIVLDERTAMPVPGSDVVLKTYTNTLYNDVTNSSGIVDFVGVEETWPPADLPTGNSYYNYGERIHSVNVSHTSGVYLPVNKTISVLNKGENITITVYLKTQGGL